ncbi:hypothetical protein LPJ53_000825 [Coemansia erecta]|uniref:Uncharacterized protein n=1 Tax=Coemansia erecta TaxID=147472 RepID=A0A9W7Y4R2_9FUNG|nr:hypothetical protein LPJ53_000825 [Coemansia erecta]
MRCAAGIFLVGAIVHTGTVVARPVPQYGPQGMGNYGYPMGGQMMGGGGPMMGPYGMGNDQWGGPMYNNMPGGDGNSHYRNGRARGQRYHAHAGVDEWPIPKNPYMNARWNKHSNHAQLYANDGQMNMGGPMMGPSGHNRIPMDEGADKDDADSDNDDDADSGKSASKDSASSATAADSTGDVRVATGF